MKRRSRAVVLVRFASRIAMMLLALVLFSLAAVQFARLIDQNIAMARELSSANADIDALQLHRARQLHDLRRLEDPDGAIPDIHDRLRLLRNNEEIIFVKPAPK